MLRHVVAGKRLLEYEATMTAQHLWHATLVLDKSGKISLQQQLIAHFRHLIASGLWSPGQRCPSSRIVAQQLQINRKTISRVYAALAAQGLIYTRAKQGTFVSMLAGSRTQRGITAPTSYNGTPAKLSLVQSSQTAKTVNHLAETDPQHLRIFKRIVAHYHRLLDATPPADIPATFLLAQDSQGPKHLREGLAALLNDDRHFKVQPEYIACGSALRLLEALGRFLPADGVLLVDDALTTDEAAMLSHSGQRLITLPEPARGRFSVLLEQLEKFAINYPITALWCDTEQWLSGRHRHTECAVLSQKLANYGLWLIDDQRRRLPNWLGQSPLAAHYEHSLLVSSLYGKHCAPLNLTFMASPRALPEPLIDALMAQGPVPSTAALYAHQQMLLGGDYRQLLTSTN